MATTISLQREVPSTGEGKDFLSSLPEEMKQHFLAFLPFKDLCNIFRAVPSIARDHEYKLINLALLSCFDKEVANSALVVAGKVKNLALLQTILKRSKNIDPKTRDNVFKGFSSVGPFPGRLGLPRSHLQDWPSPLRLAIIDASRIGYEEVVKAMLYCATKEDINLSFQIASRQGHEAVVKVIIDSFGDKVSYGYPLEESSRNGDINVVKAIIGCSQFPKISIEHLNSALMESRCNNHIAVAVALINSAESNKIHEKNLVWTLAEAIGNGHTAEALAIMASSRFMQIHAKHADQTSGELSNKNCETITYAMRVAFAIRKNMLIHLAAWLAYSETKYTFISQINYHLVGRVALLGISLFFLAEMITRIFISKIAFLALSLITSKQIEDFAVSQKAKQTAASLTGWNCLKSLIYPKELSTFFESVLSKPLETMNRLLA